MLHNKKYIIDKLDECPNNSDDQVEIESEVESESESESDKKEEIVIGIDLGTTNSCVSVWRNGNIEIIPDEFGNRTIPSIVSFTNVSRYIGKEAKNQKNMNPEHTYYEIKRLIGRKIDDMSVINDIPFLTYKIFSDSDNKNNDDNEDKNILLKCDLRRRKKYYTPEEISSMILMKLKHMAEDYLKQPIDKAVITVPAYFNDSQRQATKDAATIAGLECVRILNEPTAAALAYGLENRSLFKDNDLNILVYDFGGGTLDCSLLNISDGFFEVMASTGNTHLGGADFDNRLINYCRNQFKKKNKINKLENLSLMSLQKLKKSCENAKKMLSIKDKTVVAVENFYEDKNLYVVVTKKTFEYICRDLFILCIKSVEDILKICEMKYDEIDDIILVGGATRMPLVQENLRKYFGGKSPNCNVNPDEVVAVGAGIQAYIINHKSSPFAESIVLLDVTPLSLGVETIGGVMNTLIPRNSTIPITRKRLYTTDTDDQSEVTVKIFEGERKMTKDNFCVGQFDLTGIEKAPRGIAEIEITFSVDINGIISVTALDKKNSDNKTQITVTGNKGRLSVDKIKDLVQEAENMEMKDKLEREKKQCYYEVEDLCSNIILNINDKDFKLKENDKEYIQNDVDNILSWLKRELYHKRDKKEYNRVIKQIKKKYGTLMLRISHIKSDNIKSVNNNKNINATNVYCDGIDNEDDCEDQENIFEKIREEDIGITDDMEEEDKKELKDMRSYLVDLCYTVFDIISKGDLNNNDSDKTQIVKDTVNDILLWAHVKEKINKQEYQEKIDVIDNLCNDLFDELNNDKNNIFQNEDQGAKEDLEQLCYAINCSIENNMLPAKDDKVEKLKKMIDETLEWIIDVEVKMAKDNMAKNNVNNNIYKKKMDMINDYCDEIYHSILNININDTNINILEKDKFDNTNNSTSLSELRKKQN